MGGACYVPPWLRTGAKSRHAPPWLRRDAPRSTVGGVCHVPPWLRTRSRRALYEAADSSSDDEDVMAAARGVRHAVSDSVHGLLGEHCANEAEGGRVDAHAHDDIAHDDSVHESHEPDPDGTHDHGHGDGHDDGQYDAGHDDGYEDGYNDG